MSRKRLLKMPPKPLDPDTLFTLRQMVGYMPDDERIARYLGIDIGYVLYYRDQRPTCLRGRPPRKPDAKPLNEQLHVAKEPWAVNAALASEMLAGALDSYQKKMTGRHGNGPSPSIPTKGSISLIPGDCVPCKTARG